MNAAFPTERAKAFKLLTAGIQRREQEPSGSCSLLLQPSYSPHLAIIVLDQCSSAKPSGCYHTFMSLNDLEFAYSPVRNQVRDLREYL